MAMSDEMPPLLYDAARAYRILHRESRFLTAAAVHGGPPPDQPRVTHKAYLRDGDLMVVLSLFAWPDGHETVLLDQMTASDVGVFISAVWKLDT